MTMSTINPFLLMIIYIVLLWVLDDVFLYFLIEFSLIIVLLNQDTIFSTIPTAISNNMWEMWVTMLVIAMAKHIHLANKAKKKYGNILGGM